MDGLGKGGLKRKTPVAKGRRGFPRGTTFVPGLPVAVRPTAGQAGAGPPWAAPGGNRRTAGGPGRALNGGATHGRGHDRTPAVQVLSARALLRPVNGGQAAQPTALPPGPRQGPPRAGGRFGGRLGGDLRAATGARAHSRRPGLSAAGGVPALLAPSSPYPGGGRRREPVAARYPAAPALSKHGMIRE